MAYQVLYLRRSASMSRRPTLIKQFKSAISLCSILPIKPMEIHTLGFYVAASCTYVRVTHEAHGNNDLSIVSISLYFLSLWVKN